MRTYISQRNTLFAIITLITIAFTCPLYSQFTAPTSPFIALDTTTPPPGIELITSDSPCPGKFFISNIDRTTPTAKSHLLIIDNNGNVFESKYLHTAANNFQMQPNGQLTYYANAESQFYVLDSNFNTIRTIKAEQTFGTGFHELLIFDNGNYMVIGRQSRVVDLSHIGGSPTASVTDCALLEYDKNDNKVFEWNSKDHFNVTDATFENFSSPTISYCHINGIEIDNDNNILISSRNMDEITKIDRLTGNIIWRFGGKNNQFALIGDTIFFNHQHSIRVLPNGNYILFDNGNFNNPALSRACEYKLDTSAMTATLVWKYVHPLNLYSFATGSIQWLPNDNILIGWGADRRITATEVDRLGNTKCEFRLSDYWETYRVYKHLWQRQPVTSVNNPKYVNQHRQPKIFPNPASNRFSTSFYLDGVSDVHISLIDELGRAILTKDHLQCSPGYSTVSIDITSVASGVYTVRLQNATSVSYSRLVVE